MGCVRGQIPSVAVCDYVCDSFCDSFCRLNEKSAPAVAGAYCRGRYALRAHCMWHSSDRLIVCRPPKNVCDSSAMHLATQLAMHLLYAISRRDES